MRGKPQCQKPLPLSTKGLQNRFYICFAQRRFEAIKLLYQTIDDARAAAASETALFDRPQRCSGETIHGGE
jgi:hypothetical protein